MKEDAIDFHKEKPFNLDLILKRTDEFITILESLDVACPFVFAHQIKRLKELKYQYDLARQRKPKLFN